MERETKLGRSKNFAGSLTWWVTCVRRSETKPPNSHHQHQQHTSRWTVCILASQNELCIWRSSHGSDSAEPQIPRKTPESLREATCRVNPRKNPSLKPIAVHNTTNDASKRHERSGMRGLPAGAGSLGLGGTGTPTISTAVAPAVGASVIAGITSITSIGTTAAPTVSTSVVASASTGASVVVLEVRISLELEVGRRGALGLIRQQEVGHLLLGLHQSASQHRRNGLIPVGVEG